MPPIPPHIVCTPFRPPAATFDPRWRTVTAVALAHGIVSDVAFDRFPILADALEEAGCDDPTTLRHCRECRVHTTQCWVLGDLLDLPPPVIPRLMTDEEIRREVERLTGRPLFPSPREIRIRERLRWVWWGLWVLVVAVVVFVVPAALRPIFPRTPPYPTQTLPTSPDTTRR